MTATVPCFGVASPSAGTYYATQASCNRSSRFRETTFNQYAASTIPSLTAAFASQRNVFMHTLRNVGRDVCMAQVLQVEGMPRQFPQKLPAAAVLTALGVVYGDIGTSTLYGLKQA